MANCEEDWQNSAPQQSSGGYSGHRSHEDRSYGGGRDDRDSYRNRRDQWGSGGGGEGRERRGRGEGGGGGGGGRRQMDFSEEMDIRSDCVGMIIGRGGSNIQRIQSDFNVRVDLDKGRNVVTVSGNSESGVKDALRDIQDKMDNAEVREGGGGGGRDGGRGGGRDGGSRDYGRDRRSNDNWRSGGGGGERRDYYADERSSGGRGGE